VPDLDDQRIGSDGALYEMQIAGNGLSILKE